jgi:hypothetical protein
MTVAAQYSVIAGPHDLKVVTELASNSPETKIATAATIGCFEDGFTLSWQLGYEDVTADCTGETVIDGVYTGVKSASLEGVLLGYDAYRTSVQNLIWPHGEFGEVTEIGKMSAFGSTGATGTNSSLLVAVPRAGTPGAVATQRWYFYCAAPDPDETFAINFNNKPQAVPVSFRLHPIINEDAIDAGTDGNRIYYPSDNVSSLNLAQHSYRLWRRLAV